MSNIIKSMVSDKQLIINVALGAWYPKGQKRLIESLKQHFNGDIKIWKDKWPNANYEYFPYNCKASALEEAIKLGYKKIFWMDCSVWAIKDVQPLFDIIERDGYYFINNGYNCAQTCSDDCLRIFDVTRDEAEGMKEVATTIFGLDLSKEHAFNFAKAFIQATKNGAGHGSRLHDNQSEDERFLFHRQDQSVASILFNKSGFNITHNWGDHLEYLPHDEKKHTLLLMQGM